MFLEIHCSSCREKLRIKTEWLGSTLRCPQCQAALTLAAPAEADDRDKPSARRGEARQGSEAQGDEDGDERRRSRRKREREHDEELDERPSSRARRSEPADDEDRDRPRRRRRRRRLDVDALLRPPAISLKIVAWVGAGLSIVVLIVRVVGALRDGLGPINPAAGMVPGPSLVILRAVSALLGTAGWSWVLLRGSDAMYSRQGYGWAVAGCIVAMAPGSVGWLGGLPVGIWGLVILCRTDVKRSFSSSKDGWPFQDLFSFMR